MSQSAEGTSFSDALAMQTGEEDASIVFRGAVFKLARNGRLAPQWHKRYAVLNSEGHLYLYSDEGMRSVRRVIDLQQMCLRIKFGTDTNDDYCSNWPKRVPPERRFSLINMDRTYHFFTASEKEATSWKASFLSIAEAKSIFTANWALSAEPSESAANQDVQELAAKPKHPMESPLHALFDTERPANTVTVVEEEEGDELEEVKEDSQVLVGEEEGESHENEPPPQHMQKDPVSSPLKEEPSPYDDYGSKQQSSLSDKHATFEGGAASKKKKKKTSLRRSVSSEVKEDRFTMKSSAMEEISSTHPQESGGSIEEMPVASDATSPGPLEMAFSPPSPIANMGEDEEAPKEEEGHSHAPAEQRMSDYESQVHRLSQNLGRVSGKRTGKRLLWPQKSESPDNDRSPTSVQEEGETRCSVAEASFEESHTEKQENSGSSPSLGEMVNAAKKPVDQAIAHMGKEEAKTVNSREAFDDKSTSPVKQPIRAISSSFPLSSVPETGPLAFSAPQDKQHTQGHSVLSVKEKVKALTAGGTPSPPHFQPQTAKKGRHRRVSEPVKAAVVMVKNEQEHSSLVPKEEGVEEQSAEPARKKSMKKYTSESMVGGGGKAKGGPHEPLPWEQKEEEGEVEDRLQAAAKWVDKELRKLISEIKRLGRQNEQGHWEVEFGPLFEETTNLFEALSGILKTAKKHKILTYQGELLFQGIHNNVVITLLKEEVEDSTIAKYTTTNPKGMKRTDLPPEAKKKTTGFSSGTTFTGNAQCVVCLKRVYATEFVAANDKPMHKLCFKCVQCGKTLTTSTFATIDDRFYCIPHYERLYLEKGNYSKL